ADRPVEPAMRTVRIGHDAAVDPALDRDAVIPQEAGIEIILQAPDIAAIVAGVEERREIADLAIRRRISRRVVCQGGRRNPCRGDRRHQHQLDTTHDGTPSEWRATRANLAQLKMGSACLSIPTGIRRGFGSPGVTFSQRYDGLT